MWVKSIDDYKYKNPKTLNYWMYDEQTNKIELPRNDNNGNNNDSGSTIIEKKQYFKMSKSNILIRKINK
jgi:hypothetical protein